MYTIKEVLVFKNKHGIEFTKGFVIEGPRGGVYLVDEFCAEVWLHTIDIEYRNRLYALARYTKPLINENKIGVCFVDMTTTNDFITPNKYKGKTEFRRRYGLAKLKSTGIFDKIQFTY